MMKSLALLEMFSSNLKCLDLGVFVMNVQHLSMVINEIFASPVLNLSGTVLNTK